ncbi:MAG: TolC family protein [Bacteroidales bacterium]
MKRTGILIMMLVTGTGVSAQTTLGLDDCRKLALEHNKKIIAAREQVAAAGELVKAAFANYLPEFSLNATYSYFGKDFQLLSKDLFLPVVPYSAIDPATGQLSSQALSNPAVAANTFVINPSTGSIVKDANGNPVFQKYTCLPASESKFRLGNLYMINGGLTQPIYMGGKIRELNRMAATTKMGAENNLRLNENELLYSVDEAYWRIISLREKVRLAEKYSSMLERLVKDLSNIHDEGIITKNDLLRASVKQSEAELMKLKAINGLELSMMSLCQITGIVYSRDILLADSLDTRLASPSDLQVSEASINGRPELAVLQNSADLAKSGVKLAVSRYLPNIGLTAGYSVINPNPYNGLEKEFGGDLSFGIICNVPLFHFGEKRHTVNAARAGQRVAEIKLDEARELMLLQLQQAVYRYTESEGKKRYADLALGQAAENLAATKNNFDEGTMKTTDLLEAQVIWQKAYSELIDARTEQQLAASYLKKVTSKY